ncbi:hypothetical protein ACH5RR_024409 [Cinchona calisaya]|uniref:DEAD/DEAH-box helicase domain-containing protein n=1 Tax=Cinchona calisaya TaxID=153742 RepID=A0ABD2YWK5_9GENT
MTVWSLRKFQIWIGLTPFNKNFYLELPSTASMSESEVEYRRRWEITLDGPDVPKPVESFQDVGFPGGHAMQKIERAGFSVPTPVQAQGWPMALKGRNLIGIAETGSGKTLAYLLPAIVHHTMDNHITKFPRGENDSVPSSNQILFKDHHLR